MNRAESPLSSATPDLAALAATSAVLRRAASLAGWAASARMTLTPKGVLRKQDVPAAAAIVGVKEPRSFRSAADLPELNVAWSAAIGMGLLSVDSGKASGGPELKDWPPDDGAGLLEAWLKGFLAVSAVLGGGDRARGKGVLVLVLAILKVLRDSGTSPGHEPWHVLERADKIGGRRYPATRTSYTFYGRARIENDPAARAAIFDNSHPRERQMDFRRRGVAIVVDLDRLEGRGPEGRLLMVRSLA